VGEIGGFWILSPELLKISRERNSSAMADMFAGAINFKIVHDDLALPFYPHVNKRIRNKHADRIKHVGVVLAVCDDQQVVPSHWLKLPGEFKQKQFGIIHIADW
jgi:hypothetical protein